MMTACSRALLLAVAMLLACGKDDGEPEHDHGHDGPDDHGAEPLATDADAGSADSLDGFAWRLPSWFPKPVVPADNPMSELKVQLGRHLFYDPQLSANGTQACASCHHQELGFTDGKLTALGSTGQVHPRNSMGLANVAYSAVFTWGNPLVLQLEAQAMVPIFGSEPIELGMKGKEDELVARLRATERYQSLFPRAFPDDVDPFSIGNLVRAISAFERTLVSGDSAYDRYAYGHDSSALSESAQRGLQLFNSERLECFHCHNGFALQDSITYQGKGPLEVRFHNTGLYNIDGHGAYPAPNTGVHEITGKPEDMGRFRTPSLRNIALTAPYMHDGSIATLDGVLDHYAAGGRKIESGPFKGDGSKSPLRSALLVGFKLTAQERADVLAFLNSLTDETFVADPAFADPWSAPCDACSSPAAAP